ncbi:PREDICTED: coiled-coil domain-containing protein 50-like [Amphimedon queenslandica]|uniref:Coiled-coil domain-containing protein n=1 Tax=Amphimedon queenslandica TaxID=400682 RepID=A0A1X7V9P8_AMPQE|nr:PREDICTED: coiled-coil domain-containing protein 50-like [Amphimedon queenslandica]|eukprot:XP_019850199.1 PREDICTED: coiled-coil domain-containing protein 50-like [Amphimedon queenslandica]
MSLLEENLPGVGRVKKDFQVREDHVIAKQLQEKEYEDHFDSNVQARRTAMKDAQMAKSYQATEMSAYNQEESVRRDRLREQEERDREAAERYAHEIQQQEEQTQQRQRQDEEAVRRLHREEMEREAQRKRQEEEDNRIALQHAQENESLTKRRQQEAALGEQEARRLQQMEAKPSGMDLPSYEELGFSLPPPPPPTGGEEEEEYVDEAARQEDEDARLARELLEREEREAQRRRREQELADIEMARKLQEMESKGGRPKPTGHPSDADIARRMELEARERQRKMESQVQADAEIAQRVKSDLYRQHSEQEMNDWELAKRLQKAEIVAHKKAAQVRGGGPPGGASFSHSSRPVAASSPTQSLPATMPSNGQYRGQGQGTERVMVRPAESASTRLQRQGTDPQLTGYYPAQGGDRPSPDSPHAVQAYKRQPAGVPGKDGKKGKGKKK